MNACLSVIKYMTPISCFNAQRKVSGVKVYVLIYLIISIPLIDKIKSSVLNAYNQRLDARRAKLNFINPLAD